MRKQLNVAIAKTDEQEQTATGLVYAPLALDSQGDFMTAPDIKAASQRFMKSGRTSSIDCNHDGQYVDAFIAESMISKGDDFPAGSWVITAKIEDPHVWKAVRGGKLTGFSMMGKGSRTVAKLGDQDAHQLHDVEIEAISLVHRAANMERFSVVKSNVGVADALNSIAQAIAKMDKAMDGIRDTIKKQDEMISALPGNGGRVHKAAPVPQFNHEIEAQRRKRSRLERKLEQLWAGEGTGVYSEAELQKSIARCEDRLADLDFHDTPDQPLGYSGGWYQRGGTSSFVTADLRYIDDELGLSRAARSITKSDEDDIDLNCMVL